MVFYVVIYDLVKKSESEYHDLWDELDSLDSVKTQDSVYLVSSAKTQSALLDLLKQHISAAKIEANRRIRQAAVESAPLQFRDLRTIL